jgi:hypothetical protein
MQDLCYNCTSIKELKIARDNFDEDGEGNHVCRLGGSAIAEVAAVVIRSKRTVTATSG